MSTFSEGHHGFDVQRERFDPYTRHTVMSKFSRPATAPSRPNPEVEPEQISNTYSDTSPERDTDARARGRPSIKRKVLRYGSGFRRLVFMSQYENVIFTCMCTMSNSKSFLNRKHRGQPQVCDESTQSEDSGKKIQPYNNNNSKAALKYS